MYTLNCFKLWDPGYWAEHLGARGVLDSMLYVKSM